MNTVLHRGDLGHLVTGKEIGENEWAVAKGTTLITRDASTCAVAALYDEGNGYALLGHFAMHPRLTQQPPFRGFIAAAMEHTRATSTDAWVSGVTLLALRHRKRDQNTYNELAAYNRLLIAEQLGKVARKGVEEVWLETNQKLQTVIFETMTGTLHYAIQAVDN